MESYSPGMPATSYSRSCSRAWNLQLPYPKHSKSLWRKAESRVESDFFCQQAFLVPHRQRDKSDLTAPYLKTMCSTCRCTIHLCPSTHGESCSSMKAHAKHETIELQSKSLCASAEVFTVLDQPSGRGCMDCGVADPNEEAAAHAERSISDQLATSAFGVQERLPLLQQELCCGSLHGWQHVKVAVKDTQHRKVLRTTEPYRPPSQIRLEPTRQPCPRPWPSAHLPCDCLWKPCGQLDIDGFKHCTWTSSCKASDDLLLLPRGSHNLQGV